MKVAFPERVDLCEGGCRDIFWLESLVEKVVGLGGVRVVRWKGVFGEESGVFRTA